MSLLCLLYFKTCGVCSLALCLLRCFFLGLHRIAHTTGQQPEPVAQPPFQSNGCQSIALGNARKRHDNDYKKWEKSGDVFQLLHRHLQFCWRRVPVRRSQVQFAGAMPGEHAHHPGCVNAFHDQRPNHPARQTCHFSKFHGGWNFGQRWRERRKSRCGFFECVSPTQLSTYLKKHDRIARCFLRNPVSMLTNN